MSRKKMHWRNLYMRKHWHWRDNVCVCAGVDVVHTVYVLCGYWNNKKIKKLHIVCGNMWTHSHTRQSIVFTIESNVRAEEKTKIFHSVPAACESLLAWRERKRIFIKTLCARWLKHVVLWLITSINIWFFLLHLLFGELFHQTTCW